MEDSVPTGKSIPQCSRQKPAKSLALDSIILWSRSGRLKHTNREGNYNMTWVAPCVHREGGASQTLQTGANATLCELRT